MLVAEPDGRGVLLWGLARNQQPPPAVADVQTDFAVSKQRAVDVKPRVAIAPRTFRRLLWLIDGAIPRRLVNHARVAILAPFQQPVIITRDPPIAG